MNRSGCFVPPLGDLPQVLGEAYRIRPIVPLVCASKPFVGVVNWPSREILVVHREHLGYFDPLAELDKTRLQRQVGRLARLIEQSLGERTALRGPLDELLLATGEGGSNDAVKFFEDGRAQKLLDRVLESQIRYVVKRKPDTMEEYFKDYLHFPLTLYLKMCEAYIQLLVCTTRGDPGMEYTWTMLRFCLHAQRPKRCFGPQTLQKIYRPLLVPVFVRYEKNLRSEDGMAFEVTGHELEIQPFKGFPLTYDTTSGFAMVDGAVSLDKDSFVQTVVDVDIHSPEYKEAVKKVNVLHVPTNEKLAYLFAHTTHFAAMLQSMVESSSAPSANVENMRLGKVTDGLEAEELVRRLQRFCDVRIQRDFKHVTEFNDLQNSPLFIDRPYCQYTDRKEMDCPDSVLPQSCRMEGSGTEKMPPATYGAVSVPRLLKPSTSTVIKVYYDRSVDTDMMGAVPYLFTKDPRDDGDISFSSDTSSIRICGTWSRYNLSECIEFANLGRDNKYHSNIQSLKDYNKAQYALNVRMQSAVGSFLMQSFINKHAALSLCAASVIQSIYAVGKRQQKQYEKQMEALKAHTLLKPNEFTCTGDNTITEFLANRLFFRFRVPESHTVESTVCSFDLDPCPIKVKGKMFIPCTRPDKGTKEGDLDHLSWCTKSELSKAPPYVSIEEYDVKRLVKEAIEEGRNRAERFLRYIRPMYINIHNLSLKPSDILCSQRFVKAPVSFTAEMDQFKGKIIVCRTNLVPRTVKDLSVSSYVIVLENSADLYHPDYYTARSSSSCSASFDIGPVDSQHMVTLVETLKAESFDGTVAASQLNLFNLPKDQYTLVLDLLPKHGLTLEEDEQPRYAEVQEQTASSKEPTKRSRYDDLPDMHDMLFPKRARRLPDPDEV
ncbi:UNVERIFIED_CONTAM: hypothetical protein FKN15_048309 [Acipenser sinensis]